MYENDLIHSEQSELGMSSMKKKIETGSTWLNGPYIDVMTSIWPQEDELG